MTTARRSLSGIHPTHTNMKISLRRALELAVGPANVDAAGHAVADWFDSIDRNATATRVREALRDQPDQPAPAVPHSRPDTSLRAELLQKLATQREVLLNLCDRVDRLEMRADGLTPIERVQRRWAKERSVKESLTVGGDGPAVSDDREPASSINIRAALERLVELDDTVPHNRPGWAQEWSDAIATACAVLTDGPAVQSREPASGVDEPTDEELLGLDQLEAAWNAQADPANGWNELGLDEIIAWAQRQALARWGHQPAPPAEGEVGE
jgi:hypothetical protein